MVFLESQPCREQRREGPAHPCSRGLSPRPEGRAHQRSHPRSLDQHELQNALPQHGPRRQNLYQPNPEPPDRKWSPLASGQTLSNPVTIGEAEGSALLRFSPSTLSITSSRMPGLLPSSLASASTGQNPLHPSPTGIRPPQAQQTGNKGTKARLSNASDHEPRRPGVALSDDCRRWPQ